MAAGYIITLVWAFKRDKEDVRKLSYIPLCGRDGAFKYEVNVVTGRYGGSGNFYFLQCSHVQNLGIVSCIIMTQTAKKG